MMATNINGIVTSSDTTTTDTAILNTGGGSDIGSRGPYIRTGLAGSGPVPATSGSRTLTQVPTETAEEDPSQGSLHLTGSLEDRPRVQWDDKVIDNENMNKKKSKICCIFTKQKKFDESSDESSSDSDSVSSGSESDGGPVSFNSGGGNKDKDKKREGNDDKEHACNHSGHDHDHDHHHKPKTSKKKNVNAYERAPKVTTTPKPRPI